MADRYVYLKIVVIPGYSPVNPPNNGDRIYKRDCMQNPGHDNGVITDNEVNARKIDALVYREYYDKTYQMAKIERIILDDVNEPQSDHIPGTVIYTHPGEYGLNDRLKIVVLNGDDQPHSFHIHGLEYGIDSDGSWPFGTENTNRIKQGRSDEICPGDKWTYTFKVTNDMIGAWPFHDHYKMLGDNINRGLFGAIIVVPDADSSPPSFQLPVAWQNAVNNSNQSLNPNTMQLFGLGAFLEEYSELDFIQPQSGDIVHAPIFIHNIASPQNNMGASSQIAAAGATGFSEIILNPNSTGYIDFQSDGDYAYFCRFHSEMQGAVHVSNSNNNTTADVYIPVNEMAFSPTDVFIKTNGRVTWHNQQTSAQHSVTSADLGGLSSICFNGRSFVGNTPTIELQVGRTKSQSIRWYVFNLDLGMGWHNFHTHGMRFKKPIFKFNMMTDDNIVREDVRSVGPAESFVLDTAAPAMLPPPYDQFILDPNEPVPPGKTAYNIKGEFLFHCHVEGHMMTGLAGLVRAKARIALSLEEKEQLENDIGLPLDDGSNKCPNPSTGRCIDFEKGIWETLPPPGNNIIMMHAILLPNTDKVLFWSYVRFSADNFRQSTMWDNSSETYVDPLNQPATAYHPVGTTDNDASFVNLHSSQHTHLNTDDSAILVHGGYTDHPNGDLAFIFHFNSLLNKWEWVILKDGLGNLIKTQDGRFYSTTVMLPNTNGKQAITFYGAPSSETGISYSYEIFDYNSTQWSSYTQIPHTGDDPWLYQYYPWTYVLPNGDFIFAGHEEVTRRFILNTPNPPTLLAKALTGKGNRSRNTPKPPGPPFNPYDNEDGTSVILPLRPDTNGNYTDVKVLIAGGDSDRTWSSTQIADLSSNGIVWSDAPDLNIPRTHQVNSVILANGHIFLAGGAVDVTQGGPCEILDPNNIGAGWFKAAVMAKKRWYHSGAILQTDGSVLMGGDDERGQNIPGANLPLERYKPPYFFDQRPIISNQVFPIMNYAGEFSIQVEDDPNLIVEVAIIRPGAVTHGWNMTQRYVELKIAQRIPGIQNFIVVKAPPTEFVAPPGYYMLFTMFASTCLPGEQHDCGPIPSIAKWIRLQ